MAVDSRHIPGGFQPLFVTCDEPVILRIRGDVSHVQHLPNWAKVQQRRKKDARRPSRSRSRNADTVHVYPSRPAIGERADWLLKTTFKAFHHVIFKPWRIGKIMAATLALLYFEHVRTT